MLAQAEKYANANEIYKLHGTMVEEATKGKEEKLLQKDNRKTRHQSRTPSQCYGSKILSCNR